MEHDTCGYFIDDGIRETPHTASPVPPEEVFLLLCDLREGVPAADQVQLLVVAVSQRVVTGQPVTLETTQDPGIRPTHHTPTLGQLHTPTRTQTLTDTRRPTHRHTTTDRPTHTHTHTPRETHTQIYNH